MLEDTEWLKYQYCVLKNSIATIAKSCNASYWVVDRYIVSAGIEKRVCYYKGFPSSKGRKASDATKQKISAAKKGQTVSQETRAKISQAMRGREFSEEHKRKLSISKTGDKNPMYGIRGKDHPTYQRVKSVEEREMISARNKSHTGKDAYMYGKHHSLETKHKMSLSRLGKYSGKNSPSYGKPASVGSGTGHGNYFYHPDGRRIWLRSSYELRMANILTKFGIRWLYEVPIQLTNNMYRPDFYLYDFDVWLEIKGYWWPVYISRMKECYKIYPTMKLYIVHEDDLLLAESCKTFPINSIGITLEDLITEWYIEGI